MATSKIKHIEDKTYQGKVTGHIITLEDGVGGYLDDKNSDKVLVGDTVEYTITPKKNKNGGDYNLLTLKRAGAIQSAPTPPTPPQTAITPLLPKAVSGDPAILQLKHQNHLKVADIIMKAICDGKIETSTAEFKVWFDALTAELDNALDVAAK